VDQSLPIIEALQSHSDTHITVSRNLLDEWSAQRQRPPHENTKHLQRTDISDTGRIRTLNPSNERPQTHALDRAATEINPQFLCYFQTFMFTHYFLLFIDGWTLARQLVLK